MIFRNTGVWSKIKMEFSCQLKNWRGFFWCEISVYSPTERVVISLYTFTEFLDSLDIHLIFWPSLPWFLSTSTRVLILIMHIQLRLLLKSTAWECQVKTWGESGSQNLVFDEKNQQHQPVKKDEVQLAAVTSGWRLTSPQRDAQEPDMSVARPWAAPLHCQVVSHRVGVPQWGCPFLWWMTFGLLSAFVNYEWSWY